MTSDTQNAVTTGFPLVLPALPSQPQARLVLRNNLGQVVQQWLVKQNKCTVGSAPSCNLRCELPGIAPYHALLVIGARQTFVRALAPKLTRGGSPINELLLSEENSTFELAGHRFELSRHASAMRSAPAEDLSAQAARLRFTLARPFELQNRPKRNVLSEKTKTLLEPTSAVPETIAPWMAKLIHSAIEPLECQLLNALKPVAELQAEASRRKRSRRARRAAQRLQTAANNNGPTAEQPAPPNAELQQQIEDVFARQSSAMDSLAERIADVSEQLASIDRVVAEERTATQQAIQRSSSQFEEQADVRFQQNAAIEQLQTGIVTVSTALQSLQERQIAVQSENVQWKEHVQSELGAIRESLQAANVRQADMQDSPLIVEALSRLQASQLESQDEIKSWKLDVQQQMDRIRDALSDAENSTLPAAVTAYVEDFDHRFTESMQGIGAWKADVLMQLTALREALAQSQAIETGPPPQSTVSATQSREVAAELPELPDPHDSSRDLYAAYSEINDEGTTVGWPQLNVATTAEDYEASPGWSDPQADSLQVPTSNDAYAYDAYEAESIDSEFVFGSAEGESISDMEADRSETEATVGTSWNDALFEPQQPAQLLRDDEGPEHTQVEQVHLEQVHLEQEQLEQEQLEQERFEQKRLEQERLEQERFEQERLEQERLEQEQFEGEPLANTPLAAEVEASTREWLASGNRLTEAGESEFAFEGFVDSQAVAPADPENWFSAEWIPEDLFSEPAPDGTLTNDANTSDMSNETGRDAAFVLPAMDDQATEIQPFEDRESAVRQISNDEVGFEASPSYGNGGEESVSALLGEYCQPVSDEELTANFDSTCLPVWWSEGASTAEERVDVEAGSQLDTTDFELGVEIAEAEVSDGSESGKAELEEDSVEDYMRRLLARMRGVPEGQAELPSNVQQSSSRTASSAAAGTSAANAAPLVSSWKPTREKTGDGDSKSVDSSPATLGLTGDGTLPFDPEKYVPRALAPEETKNLTAMRELANTTARSAIHKSTRQRYVTMVLLKMAIAGIGLIVASVLIAINGFNLNVGLIATFASLVVAAIWGYDAITGLKPLLEASFVLNPEVGGSQQTREADEGNQQV